MYQYLEIRREREVQKESKVYNAKLEFPEGGRGWTVQTTKP